MPAITTADLNNAKEDVDHIAAIATSDDLTAVDRLGHSKRTIAGITADMQAQLDAAFDEASGALQALVDAAEAARAGAEAARDAATTIMFPSQGFTGGGPWTITNGTLHTHLFSFIGTGFYDASNFTTAGQVISGIAGKLPFVNSNSPVRHFYI